jgi:hypothetical protein
MNGILENQMSEDVQNANLITGIGKKCREIPLTQGKVAIVDDCDYDMLSRYKWYAHKDYNKYYAIRRAGGLGNKTISMHHIVIGRPPNGLVTDHIDGNGLNNTRNNLRHVTHRVNMQNVNKIGKNSMFLGAYKEKKKWKSQIIINGTCKYLGTFDTDRDAHEAYMKTFNGLEGVTE